MDAAYAKTTPIPLEDLIRKRDEALKLTKKPVFTPREEREKAAALRRQKEVEEKQRKKLELEKARSESQLNSRIAEQYKNGGDIQRFSQNQSYSGRKRRNSPANDSEYRRSSHHRLCKYEDGKADHYSAMNSGSPMLDEKELQYIRNRYMGTEKRRRKIRRMNDKKFVFDWDANEDTSQDINPLYAERHVYQFYGRGHIGGVDPREQKKYASSYYEKLISESRSTKDMERINELAKVGRTRERKNAWDDRHWSEKTLGEMKERDWRIFKEDFNITTRGGNIPPPIRRWSESGLDQRILDVIKKVGYDTPTPIQRQAIPIGLMYRDIIGIAETGSGKTASFVIPMLAYINELPPLTDENKYLGPYALIMAPTRELVQQIEAETTKFASCLGLKCVSIVGGHTLERQAVALRDGAHIVIATVGRLRDCLDRRILVLSQCTYVVMDEADRMTDMGFEADVNYVLDALPVSNTKPVEDDIEDAGESSSRPDTSHKYRQTVMFSATISPPVERIAKQYLRRPAVVIIGVAGQVVDTIEQRVEHVTEEKKRQRLMEIMSSGEFGFPVIVFVNQKRNCDSLARTIETHGYKSVTLHGGKSQEARETALNSIRMGNKDVLVATDVAGRGIDVKNVSLVVNYDMAKSIEAYTHRIGRTGRAGNAGVAITFLTEADSEIFYDLKQLLSKSDHQVIPSWLARHEASKVKPTVQPKPRKKCDE